MGDTSLQLDSSLGGKEKIPSFVNVKEFCHNRMEEILMLMESLKESPFRGQVFQRLPKHMRRRQMSHFIKRLPRKLQNTVLSSAKEEVVAPPKRPSRKYRRRPKNLLNDYNRRQKTHVWLETHIWHAKRFHMTPKWGYKLPEKPCSKSFKACYRAAAHHCLITDISYYNVLQLEGSEDKLLLNLQKCVSPDCGLTFASKMWLSGTREGMVFLYHPNSFPYKVIGNVSFIWKPLDNENDHRTLWISFHPALSDEIFSMFKTLFSFSEEKIDVDISAIDKKQDGNMSIEGAKLSQRNVPCSKIPKFRSQDGSICMSVLKDTINRFRLTGPLSLAVLAGAFDCDILHTTHSSTIAGDKSGTENLNKRKLSEAFKDESNDNFKKLKLDNGNEFVKDGAEHKHLWWNDYYESEYRRKCLEKQLTFYYQMKRLHGPTEVPPRTVMSLVVKDPRLNLPSKRVKRVPKAGEIDLIDSSTVTCQLSSSPIWDSHIRDEVSTSKIPTSEVNKARSKLIVPGSKIGHLLEDEKQNRVPLLIIHRSSSDSPFGRKDFGSGFDILVPAGWAMPVWLSLIYGGARTGGLRESEALLFESNTLKEYFQPDSSSGETELEERYETLKTAYFNRPPSKRTNYAKFGVRSPFYCPWRVLINDWRRESGETTNAEDFYVLRNVKKLLELKNQIVKLNKPRKGELASSLSFKEEELDCLVEVSLECVGKGAPKEFALLCLPEESDNAASPNPTEALHLDSNKEIRKLTRAEHLKVLKSLRRKRRKNRIAEPSDDKMDCDEKVVSSSEEIVKYKGRIEKLWLEKPEDIDSIINSCSRKVIGFVVKGGFSFCRAHNRGLGYISLRALLRLLERSLEQQVSPLILYRNTNCTQYHFAKIGICTS